MAITQGRRRRVGWYLKRLNHYHKHIGVCMRRLPTRTNPGHLNMLCKHFLRLRDAPLSLVQKEVQNVWAAARHRRRLAHKTFEAADYELYDSKARSQKVTSEFVPW